MIDRCRQLGFDVVSVNFGARAVDTRYYNRRSEMWFCLRDWLHEGGILPEDTALLADLSAAQFLFDAGTRLKLKPKDQIKKRLGSSPDLGDALALTFAFPVVSAGRSGHRTRGDGLLRLGVFAGRHDGMGTAVSDGTEFVHQSHTAPCDIYRTGQKSLFKWLKTHEGRTIIPGHPIGVRTSPNEHIITPNSKGTCFQTD